ncbi:hypothetical protein O3P69_008022 [Scylla paramamosain]|uniref:Uncharacterized protein n=1 Tax=Scylla paramamosain TaxID=85552 RepID=A0AAW0T0L3_SCYPA
MFLNVTSLDEAHRGPPVNCPLPHLPHGSVQDEVWADRWWRQHSPQPERETLHAGMTFLPSSSPSLPHFLNANSSKLDIRGFFLSPPRHAQADWLAAREGASRWVAVALRSMAIAGICGAMGGVGGQGEGGQGGWVTGGIGSRRSGGIEQLKDLSKDIGVIGRKPFDEESPERPVLCPDVCVECGGGGGDGAVGMGVTVEVHSQ